ncbi:MAG: zinc-binding alcohol dehydrogenase family protein [Actinobacteria bacterium]|nr:zinc-binding alcohol dehydrogenase family protein [Actinomycetota bacterium]
MHAAVVTAFDSPPVYREFPVPAPGPGQVLTDVLAAGLHPRVRSQANGSHYTSSGDLPLVPGVDGVGRTPDGATRYFILEDTTMGAMAEQTAIDPRRSVVLADGSDPVAIAAAMNPAMSSWVALRRRISFQPGQRVLILGATGNAGRLAIQVAKYLGAGQVIGAGRQPDKLAELAGLGADLTVTLDRAELGKAAADVDVVLDYVWGEPTAAAMAAIVTARADRSQPLSWVEIGSLAGITAAIPSAALRAARLQLVGSGQGSVPTSDIVAELSDLAAVITSGAFQLNVKAVPLAGVTAAWSAPGSHQRLVIVP